MTVGLRVAYPFHIINLLIVPTVHAQGFDLGYMGTQLAVQCGASHTQEHTQTPAGPSWVPRTAICASVISWDGFDKLLKSALIARLLTFVQCGSHGED